MRSIEQTNAEPGFHPVRQTADVESQIETLTKLDLVNLRDCWRRTFGILPPPGLGRELMLRILAYRLQAAALGDIDRKATRLLDQLAQGNTEALSHDRSPGRNLQPGTELIREYQGQHHRVAVVRNGFSWKGTTYATLSGVARAITGSNWNGYAFFGLTRRHNG